MLIRGLFASTLLYTSATAVNYEHYWSKSSSPVYPSSSSDSTTGIPTTTTVVTLTSTVTRSRTSTTALPTEPSSSTTTMPSLTSIITTGLLTTTSLLVPTTTAQNDIFGPIQGLPPCAESISFDRLSNSRCNPANFPCICIEFARLQVAEEVRRLCPPDVATDFDRFVANTCPNNRRPTNNNTTPVPPPTTTALPAIPITTGISNLTTTAIANSTSGPFQNSTGAPTDTGLPTSFATSEILIPTTGANGEPTVAPVAPTGPPGPDFTGAAGPAVEAPAFGTVRAGLLVGAVGFMGLVFAEL